MKNSMLEKKLNSYECSECSPPPTKLTITVYTACEPSAASAYFTKGCYQNFLSNNLSKLPSVAGLNPSNIDIMNTSN